MWAPRFFTGSFFARRFFVGGGGATVAAARLAVVRASRTLARILASASES